MIQMHMAAPSCSLKRIVKVNFSNLAKQIMMSKFMDKREYIYIYIQTD